MSLGSAMDATRRSVRAGTLHPAILLHLSIASTYPVEAAVLLRRLFTLSQAERERALRPPLEWSALPCRGSSRLRLRRRRETCSRERGPRL
eukprot:scaffold731_cov261-Pinguiococcus_pyrenoidosus.AAC.51